MFSVCIVIFYSFGEVFGEYLMFAYFCALILLITMFFISLPHLINFDQKFMVEVTDKQITFLYPNVACYSFTVLLSEVDKVVRIQTSQSVEEHYYIYKGSGERYRIPMAYGFSPIQVIKILKSHPLNLSIEEERRKLS